MPVWQDLESLRMKIMEQLPGKQHPINLLLCGLPSSGKSEFIRFAQALHRCPMTAVSDTGGDVTKRLHFYPIGTQGLQLVDSRGLAMAQSSNVSQPAVSKLAFC